MLCHTRDVCGKQLDRHDEVGNRLEMGADGELITDTYDIANRLVRMQDVTATLVYTYNGDGHRVTKAMDGVTTTCVVTVLPALSAAEGGWRKQQAGKSRWLRATCPSVCPYGMRAAGQQGTVSPGSGAFPYKIRQLFFYTSCRRIEKARPAEAYFAPRIG